MTNSTVLIQQFADGLRVIAPPGAPTALDATADVDVMVLEVAGGHLTWNVLAGQPIPAAVIHDPDQAQEWVWAIYGEPVALALDEGRMTELPAAPALPALAASARRLAYAHWASQWWPASTLDGIPALDPVLLDQDVAALTTECEYLVDGADAIVPTVTALVESFPRAADYALAAGDEAHPGALVLARGSGGWDWRRCPPRLLDASERAVSWRVIRDAGVTTVAVSAVAAPGAPATVPAYLRPWARIETSGGEEQTGLELAGGAWTGEAVVPSATAVHVDIHLPGFGVPADPDPAATELRRRVREFAAARLRRAAGTATAAEAPDAPLLAEIAAAAEDSDF
ncbi:hypothetical protein [Nocardia sp. NPDC127526]|uniref:hypothetical protein n=1 Tax=Nocardia sp. NPDC127526 TaxID=3345393 RepID=UPI003635DA96